MEEQGGSGHDPAPKRPVVPVSRDMVQMAEGDLDVPLIRVWCHPHNARPPRDGDDYYVEYMTFRGALRFIETHLEAERVPLIAFRGYEINLWGLEPAPEGRR